MIIKFNKPLAKLSLIGVFIIILTMLFLIKPNGQVKAQESPQETIIYTPSTETHCSNGVCTETSYIDRTFYEENEIWNRINSTFYYNGTYWIADDNNFKVYVQGNNIIIRGENESGVYFTVPTSNPPSVSGNTLTYDISTKGSIKEKTDP